MAIIAKSTGFRYHSVGMYVVRWEDVESRTHVAVFPSNSLAKSFQQATDKQERLWEEGAHANVFRAGATRPPQTNSKDAFWNSAKVTFATPREFVVGPNGEVLSDIEKQDMIEQARLGSVERYNSNQ